MSYSLIDNWQNKHNQCMQCGSIQSVKYQYPNGYTFCNACILKVDRYYNEIDNTLKKQNKGGVSETRKIKELKSIIEEKDKRIEMLQIKLECARSCDKCRACDNSLCKNNNM